MKNYCLTSIQLIGFGFYDFLYIEMFSAYASNVRVIMSQTGQMFSHANSLFPIKLLNKENHAGGREIDYETKLVGRYILISRFSHFNGRIIKGTKAAAQKHKRKNTEEERNKIWSGDEKINEPSLRKAEINEFHYSSLAFSLSVVPTDFRQTQNK